MYVCMSDDRSIASDAWVLQQASMYICRYVDVMLRPIRYAPIHLLFMATYVMFHIFDSAKFILEYLRQILVNQIIKSRLYFSSLSHGPVSLGHTLQLRLLLP